MQFRSMIIRLWIFISATMAMGCSQFDQPFSRNTDLSQDQTQGGPLAEESQFETNFASSSAGQPINLTRDLLCVTSMTAASVYTEAGDRQRVDTSTMRALATFPALQDVTLKFTYNGQVDPTVHQQIGLHLRSLNTCNRVYMMWPVAGGPLVVSIKRNPGMSTHSECGPTGYTRITPTQTNLTVPPLTPGASHTLRVAISETGWMTGYANQTVVWSGQLPLALLDFNSSLVGIRTDGNSFTFEMFATPAVTLGSSYRNPTSIPGYGCLTPAPPAFKFAQTSVVFENGKATSVLPTSTGGPIATCSLTSGTLPSGLTLSSSCGIGGTPNANTAWLDVVIRASNSSGSFSKALKLRTQSRHTTTFAQNYFELWQGRPVEIIPAYTGNLPHLCSISPNLPAGLSLVNETNRRCAIVGTPSQALARTTFVVKTTNLINSNYVAVDLSVQPPPTISYASPSYVYARNQPMSLGPALSGIVHSCSLSSSSALPQGLSFNSKTCLISGTPTVITDWVTLVVTASNTAGSSSATVKLRIQAPLTIAYDPSSVTLRKGIKITDVTPKMTGNLPYACSISPALPSGLAFINTATQRCTITGTPLVTSSRQTYTVKATNLLGDYTATISIQVTNP